MKLKTLLLTSVGLGMPLGTAQAASIAINFAENTNQAFAGGVAIGPTGIISTNWNSTINRNTGSLASGEIGSTTTLINDSGATTTATVTWNSKNTYFTNQGNANDEQKLGVGYLDDGAAGNPNNALGLVSALVTISNIPYAQYRVYGITASDQGDNTTNSVYNSRNFVVNGSYVWGPDNTNTSRNLQASAYGKPGGAFAATGNNWVKIVQGVTTGNYWTVDASTSTLTINSIDAFGGGRSGIAGIVIEQIPEPSSTALLGLGALALAFRRRK